MLLSAFSEFFAKTEGALDPGLPSILKKPKVEWTPAGRSKPSSNSAQPYPNPFKGSSLN